MSIEKIKTVANQIVGRLPAVRGRGEEATKQALVLPMLDALGFDIWNPEEVCPEYSADFAIKKLGQKEKVDLAILINGIPRIYIEVKSVDQSLDGYEGQLARYFNSTSSVPLGVLTNGIEYRFFSDTGDQNIMDEVPFHTAKLDGIEQGLEILGKFHKTQFSPDEIRDFATQINYTKKISGFLRKHIDLGERMPNESFVRWILSEDGNYVGGKVTAKVFERFQPIVKDALQMVLRDVVRRSVAALDKEVSYPTVSSQDKENALREEISVKKGDGDDPRKSAAGSAGDASDDKGSKIITTEAELNLFAMVKDIFDKSKFNGSEIFDANVRKNVPVEVGYRDTTGYFGIYFNKSSYWVMRAVVESRNPWIGFNVKPEDGEKIIPPGVTKLSPHPYSEFRVGISSVDDVKLLVGLVHLAFQKTIDDRRKEGTT